MSNSTTVRGPFGEVNPEGLVDEYVGQSVIPCAAISGAVAALIVGLRLYARGIILRRLGLADWFIVASLIFALAAMGGTIALVPFGLGRHTVFLTYKQKSQYMQANYFTSIFYVISLCFTKLSILCLYLRILTYDSLRIATKLLIAAVIISHVYIVANLLVACVPLNAFWDFALRKTAFCHTNTDVYWSNYGLHVATDFLIFLLPLPVISKLRVPRRQKAGLLAVFLVAFGVCAISVVRMVMFVQMNRSKGSADFTFTTVAMANWTIVEICASIAIACLPTLKPLIVRLFPGFSRSTSPSFPRENMAAAAAGRHDRPLTIGTRPSRNRRHLLEDDDLEAGGIATPPVAFAREGSRRGSFGSYSDGMSVRKHGVREDEFALEVYLSRDGEERLGSREGMPSPTGSASNSERPPRPSRVGTTSPFEQGRPPGFF